VAEERELGLLPGELQRRLAQAIVRLFEGPVSALL
jgi:hypothetical protein